MVLKNVSKWGFMVLRFLDVTDTLAYRITLLEQQKTSKLNVYTKSQWPNCEYEVFFQEFSAKFRMRIGSLVILAVVLSTLYMYLLKQVLKNLKKPWRNFSYIHFGTYMTLHNTPARRADYVTESSTYPRSFCPTWYGLFGLPLLYFKNVLLHVDLTFFILNLVLFTLFATYNYLLFNSYFLIQFST